jgi:outer membrane lipoprotein-sorting protein
MLIATTLLALAASPTALDLRSLVAALASSRTWQADFVQEYVPAGFESGSSERGTVTIAPPNRLRFDYTGASPRVFALDGNVARSVDPGARTCDAVRIDAGSWRRLPLASLLDPATAEASFTTTATGDSLHLTPRTPSPELAAIDITVSTDRHIRLLEVIDGDGNHNRFSFSNWRPAALATDSRFRPALPGAQPCVPEGP